MLHTKDAENIFSRAYIDQIKITRWNRNQITAFIRELLENSFKTITEHPIGRKVALTKFALQTENPDFLNATLQLFFQKYQNNPAAAQKEKWDIFTFDTENTFIHAAANNVEQLKLLKEFFTDEIFSYAIDFDDSHGNTALHIAAHSPLSLAYLLNSYQPEDRLQAILKETKCHQSLLNTISLDENAVAAVLSTLIPPEQAILFTTKLEGGNTLIHQYANSPFMHDLLNISDFIDPIALIAPNNQGITPLHLSPLLLKFIPEDARLNALMTKDLTGRTVAHYINLQGNDLITLLSLLSPDEFIKLISYDLVLGITLFHRYAHCVDFLSHAILIIPDNELIPTLHKTTRNGDTALHYAIKSADAIRFILHAIKNDAQKVELLFKKNNQQQTIFHLAKGSPQSIRIIIDYLCQKDMDEHLLSRLNLPDNKDNIALELLTSNPELHDFLSYLFTHLSHDNLVRLLMKKNKGNYTIFRNLTLFYPALLIDLLCQLVIADEDVGIKLILNEHLISLLSKKPEHIKTLIEKIPPQVLIKLVQNRNAEGGLLHRLIDCIPTFDALFQAIDFQLRLELLIDCKQGISVLQLAQHLPNTLLYLFEHLSQPELLTALSMLQNDHSPFFFELIKSSQRDVLTYLLSKLTSIQWMSIRNTNGDTALHIAVHEPLLFHHLLSSIPQNMRYAALMQKNAQHHSVFSLAKVNDLTQNIIDKSCPPELISIQAEIDRLNKLGVFAINNQVKIRKIMSAVKKAMLNSTSILEDTDVKKALAYHRIFSVFGTKESRTLTNVKSAELKRLGSPLALKNIEESNLLPST